MHETQPGQFIVHERIRRGIGQMPSRKLLVQPEGLELPAHAVAVAKGPESEILEEGEGPRVVQLEMPGRFSQPAFAVAEHGDRPMRQQVEQRGPIRHSPLGPVQQFAQVARGVGPQTIRWLERCPQVTHDGPHERPLIPSGQVGGVLRGFQVGTFEHLPSFALVGGPVQAGHLAVHQLSEGQLARIRLRDAVLHAADDRIRSVTKLVPEHRLHGPGPELGTPVPFVPGVRPDDLHQVQGTVVKPLALQRVHTRPARISTDELVLLHHGTLGAKTDQYGQCGKGQENGAHRMFRCKGGSTGATPVPYTLPAHAFGCRRACLPIRMHLLK